MSKSVKRENIANLVAALEVANQALLEVRHAQSVGSNWYTKGADGLYAHIYSKVGAAMKVIAQATSK